MLKMLNFNIMIKENDKTRYIYWSETLDHSCRIIIIGGSVSGKY